MIFEEDDIDFLKLSARKFEEACFDLLLNLDYQGLIWRQGGADSGRDIEGRRTMRSALVGPYDEKWFFECKRYETGVPPEVLNSKIAWADAEKPNHLVVLISSYLTDGARSWLEKLAPQKPYAIHIVEGKALKKLILSYPEIVSQYFLDQEAKLLIDARKRWLVHNILPDVETMSLLVTKLDYQRLSADELAFLWCSAKLKSNEIEHWNEDNEPFCLDFMFKPLALSTNCIDPIISGKDDVLVEQFAAGRTDWEMVYNKYQVASVVLNKATKPRRGLYAFVYDSEGEGLEIIVEGTSDFNTRIRHLESGAKAAANSSVEYLRMKYEKQLLIKIKQLCPDFEFPKTEPTESNHSL